MPHSNPLPPLSEIEGMLLELPTETPRSTEMRVRLVISPAGITLVAWADSPEKSRSALQQMGIREEEIHEICLIGCCEDVTVEVNR